MVNVYLHGQMGQSFGKKWLGLAVKSVSEALHAIDVNSKGAFRKFLIDNKDKNYRIKVGKRFIQEDIEAKGPCGRQDVHIVPVIKGRKSGAGKIFAAVAIIALTVFTAGAGLGIAGLTGNIFGAYVGVAASIGLSIGTSLLLGGISQLMAPKPSNDVTSDTKENRNSFDFSGNIDTMEQGFPVPVAYGRVMIKPSPISLSYFHESIIMGGTTDTPTVAVDGNAGFQQPSIPTPNPIGQNVSITSNNNAYLNFFRTTIVPRQPLPTEVES